MLSIYNWWFQWTKPVNSCLSEIKNVYVNFGNKYFNAFCNLIVWPRILPSHGPMASGVKIVIMSAHVKRIRSTPEARSHCGDNFTFLQIFFCDIVAAKWISFVVVVAMWTSLYVNNAMFHIDRSALSFDWSVNSLKAVFWENFKVSQNFLSKAQLKTISYGQPLQNNTY